MGDPVLVWPENPTCHGENPRFSSNGVSWRPPRPRRDDQDPYEETFRTCSYCGSIHPEDLYNFLNASMGVTLGGSDWKYGWPHKFYVSGIPNPIVGEPVARYVYCGNPARLEEDEYKDNPNPVEKTDQGGFRRKLHDRQAPPSVHAKWYNEHLMDIADPTTFAYMCDLLQRHAHIKFERVDGKLRYVAPSRGYQKA